MLTNFTSPISIPSFIDSIIDKARSDGDWVETFIFEDKDGVPGIIMSGRASGDVEFIENSSAAAQSQPQGTKN